MFSRLFGLNQRGVSWFVMAGEYDRSKTEGTEKMIGVSRVFVHERFRDFDNDIGLTILSIFVFYTKFIHKYHTINYFNVQNGNNKNSICNSISHYYCVPSDIFTFFLNYLTCSSLIGMLRQGGTKTRRNFVIVMS